MALILKIKTNDGKSNEVPLSGGIILGRSSAAQIQVNDPKLSSRHAQVELIAPGEFVLVDLGSTNGIRHAGKKVPRLKLDPGTEFKMGNTEFKVEGGPTQTKTIDENTAPPVPKAKAATPPKWSEYFIKFVSSSLAKIKNQPKPLRPFKHIMNLNFIRGLQAETVWTLGYGPREIGPASVDLVIEETEAPPICFSVEPSGDDVIFKTEHPGVVRLNERSIKSDTLKHGDVISISETRITVGFVKEK